MVTEEADFSSSGVLCKTDRGSAENNTLFNIIYIMRTIVWSHRGRGRPIESQAQVHGSLSDPNFGSKSTYAVFLPHSDPSCCSDCSRSR